MVIFLALVIFYAMRLESKSTFLCGLSKAEPAEKLLPLEDKSLHELQDYRQNF